MKYLARFTGQKINAQGIFYKIETTVEAENEKQAELKLYDDFDHISNLKLHTPRFKHDCEVCEFRGNYGKYDIWICGNQEDQMKSIIARYDHDGPDYASMLTKYIRRSHETNLLDYEIAFNEALKDNHNYERINYIPIHKETE